MELNKEYIGLNISETVFDQTVEQSVDSDFIMPDYYTDIQRVLKCIAKPCISSKTVNGDRAVIDGSLLITVVYSDADNKLASFESAVNFSKSIDLDSATDNPIIYVKPVVGYMNCKAVTERKIDLHGVINLKVRIKDYKKVKLLSGINNREIETLSSTIQMSFPAVYSEKSLIIEDELAVPDGSLPLKNVILYDCKPEISECKMIGNKAIVKGCLNVQILYNTETDSTAVFTGEIPFSQVMELEGENEGCNIVCNAEVCHINIRSNQAESESGRCFAVDGKLNLFVTVICDETQNLLTDVFSPEYELETESRDISFQRTFTEIEEKFICRKNIDLGAVILGSVIDVRSSANVLNIENQDNKIVVKGSADVGILGCDNDEMPIYIERKVEFRYTADAVELPDNAHLECEINILNTGYTITSQNTIEVILELNIKTRVLTDENYTILSDVTIVGERSDDENKCCMVVYYAQKGENIWDITKRYCGSLKQVKAVNSIEEDVLSENKMLIISH